MEIGVYLQHIKEVVTESPTIVVYLIAGLLLFGERLTPGKIIGAALVMAGVVLFAFSDEGAEKE